MEDSSRIWSSATVLLLFLLSFIPAGNENKKKRKGASRAVLK
jgi:hypothetical protein